MSDDGDRPTLKGVTEISGAKQDPRTGRFRPGFSGNPAGRAKGAKSAEVRRMLDENAGPITQKLIDVALAGDMLAIKFVLERIVAPRKVNLFRFDLPKLTSVATAKEALSMVIEAQCAGELAGDEADSLVRTINSYIQVSAVAEFEERLKKLEDGGA